MSRRNRKRRNAERLQRTNPTSYSCTPKRESVRPTQAYVKESPRGSYSVSMPFIDEPAVDSVKNRKYDDVKSNLGFASLLAGGIALLVSTFIPMVKTPSLDYRNLHNAQQTVKLLTMEKSSLPSAPPYVVDATFAEEWEAFVAHRERYNEVADGLVKRITTDPTYIAYQQRADHEKKRMFEIFGRAAGIGLGVGCLSWFGGKKIARRVIYEKK